tara:strand:+ start:791 stop:2698 length:1908 start_codon:yes stop_codon:yes gene_type:complete
MSKSYRVNYVKRKNERLFETLKKEEIMNMEEVQNFIPVYNRFFKLSENNYEVVNLNHQHFVSDIKSKVGGNTFEASIRNTNETKPSTENIFCKIIPLVDPYKYLIGKTFNNKEIFNLPCLNNSKKIHDCILDVNNSAYVDSLFVYFSSILKTEYNFLHGLEYYGSVLGIKNNFVVNVYDDIEYLAKSSFFNKHKNVDFEVEDYSFILSEIMRNEESDDEENAKRPLLKIHKDTEDEKTLCGKDDCCCDENTVEKIVEEKEKDDDLSGKPLIRSLSVGSINDEIYDDLFESDVVNENKCDNTLTLEDLSESNLEIVDIVTTGDTIKLGDKDIESGSDCSSRSSHTTSSDNDEGSSNDDDEDSDEEYSSESSSESDESEEIINATIPKFPVELVFMENMEYTLDKLMMENEIKSAEWFSILMQVIMILIVYQNVFSFTHNDLHTNNIMFTSTKKQYLYYKYNDKVYKVPTYGRIAKIIDFGRSIYKYNSLVFCSDSFKPGQDAATQYNTEPYFNSSKPRLEPNMSFDLCRLACSIYDELIDDDEDIESNPVAKLIYEWCLDDDNKNILYKKNGEERYPSFKLYKMIARSVHNHTPDNQLSRKHFSRYEVKNADIPSKFKKFIFDIDSIPRLKSAIPE